MKAAWLTDIHLNFLKTKHLDAFLNGLSGEAADCFFISGDIGEAESVVGYLEQMAAVLKRPIYFVLGNHDYYGGSIKAVRSTVTRSRRPAGIRGNLRGRIGCHSFLARRWGMS